MQDSPPAPFTLNHSKLLLTHLTCSAKHLYWGSVENEQRSNKICSVQMKEITNLECNELSLEVKVLPPGLKRKGHFALPVLFSNLVD